MKRHSHLSTRILLLVLLTYVLSITTACARHTRVIVRDPQPQVVVISKGHVHSSSCGHYRHGNNWYLVKGHNHGKHCGHKKVKGVWVIR